MTLSIEQAREIVEEHRRHEPEIEAGDCLDRLCAKAGLFMEGWDAAVAKCADVVDPPGISYPRKEMRLKYAIRRKEIEALSTTREEEKDNG
jgi:hypothetical protein